MTGDTNPLHLDARYAREESPFGKPIVHGMLYGSMFGTIFGSQIPGALYLNQSFAFQKPVFVGDTVTARVKILKAREKPHILQCATTIHRHPDGQEDVASIEDTEQLEAVMSGEAKVMIPQPKQE